MHSGRKELQPDMDNLLETFDIKGIQVMLLFIAPTLSDQEAPHRSTLHGMIR